jgi:hypothetical protein
MQAVTAVSITVEDIAGKEGIYCEEENNRGLTMV